MSSSVVSLQLQRPSSGIAWGFRIQGGRDFNRPLVVSRVTCDSVADGHGLRCGDQIVAISGSATDAMTHERAQQTIKQAGTSIQLTVSRSTEPQSMISAATWNKSAPLQTWNKPNPNSRVRLGIANDVQHSHSQYDLKFKVAICKACAVQIRGPFVIAMDLCFCPGHFLCSCCQTDLTKSGFVERDGQFYCEKDYRQFMAPQCAHCQQAIVGEEVIALDSKWHPHCFTCTRCRMGLGDNLFKIGDDNQPYCEPCWSDSFQIKCTKCALPITITDKFVEVGADTFHVTCFCCSACRVPLAGKQYHTRNGKPFCKAHAYAGVLFAN